LVSVHGIHRLTPCGNGSIAPCKERVPAYRSDTDDKPCKILSIPTGDETQ